MDWNQAVLKLTPYIVKIHTPTGTGTGFLCMYNDSKTLCGIATAAHVVNDTDEWQQPMRIVHQASGQTIFLQEKDRFILSQDETDSSIILFSKEKLKLPEDVIKLLPLTSPLKIGNEVAWLGYPAIDSQTLCFFSGNISAVKSNGYLIDGVAIHGVSGGPVMYVSETDGVQIVGIVSAYRANRSSGETLPGLLSVQDVSHFHKTIEAFRSIDEANRKKAEAENIEAAKKAAEANVGVPAKGPVSEPSPKIPSRTPKVEVPKSEVKKEQTKSK
jgi:hypothetical protein